MATISQVAVKYDRCSTGYRRNQNCYFSIATIQYFINDCVYNSEVTLVVEYYKIVFDQVLKSYKTGQNILIFVNKNDAKKILLSEEYYTNYASISRNSFVCLFVFAICFPCLIIIIYVYVKRSRENI